MNKIVINQWTSPGAKELSEHLKTFGSNGKEIIVAFDTRHQLGEGGIVETANQATRISKRFRFIWWMSEYFSFGSVFVGAFITWLLFVFFNSPDPSVFERPISIGEYYSAWFWWGTGIIVGISVVYCVLGVTTKIALQEYQNNNMWVVRINNIFSAWKDHYRVGIDPHRRVNSLVRERLNELALLIVRRERGGVSTPAEIPFGAIQDHSVKNKFTELLEVAKRLGFSDGNMTPYFEWAEAEWLRLAASGEMLVDFQI